MDPELTMLLDELAREGDANDARAIADYLARVKSHPDLRSVTLPVGKGEEVSLKLR